MQTLGFLRIIPMFPICLATLLLIPEMTSPASADVSFDTRSNCSMRYVQIRVKHKNCRPVRLYARACSGACASYTTTSALNPSTLETKCDCCQYVGRKKKRFGLKCPHKKIKNRFKVAVVSITMPRKCMCRPCSTTPNRLLSAEQSILKSSPVLPDSLRETLRQYFSFK